MSSAPPIHHRLVNTLLKAHLLECAVQLGVLGLAQPEHLALLPEDDEAEELPNVHLLLEVAVEESGLDIHVMDAHPSWAASARRMRMDLMRATDMNVSP
jgi:hypothetical protein